MTLLVYISNTRLLLCSTWTSSCTHISNSNTHCELIVAPMYHTPSGCLSHAYTSTSIELCLHAAHAMSSLCAVWVL